MIKTAIKLKGNIPFSHSAPDGGAFYAQFSCEAGSGPGRTNPTGYLAGRYDAKGFAMQGAMEPCNV